MMHKVGRLLTKSMTVLDATDENRFFEGFLTVEMKDKQGEITVVDELYKVLPLWMDRGAPITDTHSNRVVGKGINFMKTQFESEGVTYPAIKITGKIHKNYELDTDIWEKIKSGEYRGLSFGGATKADRIPKVLKDGDIAYALTDLEHYEVAVCKDPAVPLALITDYNPIAKATTPSEPRGDGKEIIKCTSFGCYVDKGEDWSNADGTTPATVTNTVSQSTQTAKPVKTDDKIGKPEIDRLNTIEEVTPLEGGIQKKEPLTDSEIIADQEGKFDRNPPQTESELIQEMEKKKGGIQKEMWGTGGGVRAHPDDAYNQDDPEKQTAQNTKVVRSFSDESVNKVVGALLAGVGRAAASTVADAVTPEPEDDVEKSGYETTDTDIKLGHPAKKPKEDTNI